MTEPTGFEAHAVLVPRRRRLARFALLLPVVALVATAWAGLSGPRSDRTTADAPDPTATATPSRAVTRSIATVAPSVVIGLPVHRLDEAQTRAVGGEVVAVAGWFLPTAITDCPQFAAFYRAGSPPEVHGDADSLAFCSRSGVLYASQPDVQDRSSRSVAAPAVGVTIVAGVIVPSALEMIGADATEVVVVGRFVDFGDGCRVRVNCPRELVVDHVAWTPAA